MLMTGLTGCGYELPELTEDQEQLISDYSAALLLKYDSKSPSRLLPEGTVTHIEYVDPSEGEAAPAEVIPEGEPLDIPVDDTPQYSSEDVMVNDTDGTSSAGDGAVAYSDGFSSFLEGTGLDIEYSGHYEVVSAYPSGEDANPFLSVEASPGNKLLVLHFNLTNISSEDSAVNLGRLGLRYRVSLNGAGNKYVMTTLLTNDIMSYVGSLGVGETTDLVAVCELSDAEAETISTIDFTIKGSSNSSVISLQ